MFGFSKEEQFQKRLRDVDNTLYVIKLALAQQGMKSGVEAGSFEGLIYGQAINYLFLDDLDEMIGRVQDQQKREKLEKSKEEIKKTAIEILNKDNNLKVAMVYLQMEYSALMSYQYSQAEFAKTYKWKRIEEIFKLSGADQSDRLSVDKFNRALKEFLNNNGINGK